MGATNNKPLKSAPPRRRRNNPKNLWQRIRPSEGEGFSSNRIGMYEGPRRDINQQNDNVDLTSSWRHQNQPYYNEQNLDSRSNNDQINNFGYNEEFTQYPNNEYNQSGMTTNCNLVRNNENTDESFYNTNLTCNPPQHGGDYNFNNTRYNEENNYNYSMGPPGRPVLRRHSLNSDRATPPISHSFQNNRKFHLHSYSLNNINSGSYSGEQFSLFGLRSYASDSNVYKNNNSYYGNWKRSSILGGRRCNSSCGFNTIGNVSRGGRKRNLMDDYFDGEDFNGSVSKYSYEIQQGLGDFASCIGPRVKQRQTPDNQEANYERSGSALSDYNHSNSDGETDFPYDRLNLIKSIESDEKSNVLNILKFPSGWSSYSVNNTGFVDIISTSVEGEKLRRFFHKTARTSNFQLQIVGISRIENPFLHTLYLLKKEEMKLRNGHVDELHLYHGTKHENISNICEDNFNWRLYNEKHKFGMGVSFSPWASYSSHYCDDSDMKVMLLLKVLVSNSVIGTPEMEIPPIIDGVTYDTSIKEDTSVIVKYCDNEFYPLYKITYTKRSF